MYRQKRIIKRIGDTYENINNNKTTRQTKSTHKYSKKHKNNINNVSVIRDKNPHKHSQKRHLIIDITEEEVFINNKKSYNIIANVIDIDNK